MEGTQDGGMTAAMEEFITSRINDCGERSNPALEEALAAVRDSGERLADVLTEEQRKLFLEYENAWSLVGGETQNSFYRAGFSDAITFILGWRDMKWN